MYIYDNADRPFSVGRMMLHRDDLQRIGIDTHAYVDVEPGGVKIGSSGVRLRKVSRLPARERASVSVPVQAIIDQGARTGHYRIDYSDDAIRVDFGGAA